MVRKLMVALVLMPMMALAATWYVNGSTGSDSNSGTSQSSAKATIQAAIDASSAGDTILVAPGTYAPITTENKAITIRSTSGAGSTIIDGGGVAPCTVLCESMDNKATHSTILVGFTLRNGYVSGEWRGGAGTGGTFQNCIISDNVGYGYGAAGGCVASVVQNSLVCRNRYSNSGGWGGGALANCTDVFNCTIVNNVGYGVWDGDQANCIIYGNTSDVYVSYGNDGHNNYCLTGSLISSGVGNKSGDPVFVDAANGDYRLAAGSPCIDAGDNSYVTGDKDLASNARIANGTVDIGCYEYGSTSNAIVKWNDLFIPYEDFFLEEENFSNVKVAAGIAYLGARGKLGLSVYGRGTLTFKARGSYDGFFYNYDERDRATSCPYIRNSDSLKEYTIEFLGNDWHTVIWVTYAQGYIVDSAWGEVSSITWNGNVVQFPTQQLPIDGLVAYWPFDGNANDASGNGNHGATHGVTLTTDHLGNANGAYYIGGDGWISVASSRLINCISNDNMAISFWLKVDSLHSQGRNSYAVIVDKRNEYDEYHFGWHFIVNNGLESTNGLYMSGLSGIEDDVALSDSIGSQWNNWVVSISNGLITVFKNGLCIGSKFCTVRFPVQESDLIIGNVSSGDIGLYGSLDDLRIYNRALSAAEVKALYDGTVVTTPATYTVSFNLNGAAGTPPSGRSVAHGSAIGALPIPTWTGFAFQGWFTAANGGAQVSESTVVTGNVTYYAQWRINSYTMTFDANGGVGGTVKTQDYGTALTAPAVAREGYTFTGWSPSVPATVPAADATYTAQWRINSYTVTFDAQGGAGGGTVARNHGAALGELPVPTRDGFSFDGWFTSASGGTEVSSATVITGAVTFYAHWTEVALYPTPVWYDENGEEVDWTKYYDGDEEAFAAESAATFDGYVLDGEEVCGLVQVKVGKADRRSGSSKVSASLTLIGEAKKLSYKGTMSKRGIAELTCSGRDNLSLCLGTNAMWGELGDKTVSGARNVFAKSGDPKAGVLARWLGTYTLVLETVDAAGSGSGFAWGYSGLTLTIGSKGKVKVQGTLVDGAKVNVASQLLVGDGRCCIPVVVPLYAKKGGFALNLWLQEDGSIEAGEISKWDATASKTPFTAWWGENVPVAKTGAALPASLSFMLAGEPDVAGMEVLYDFLPWEVVFSTGARWTLPAAGNVKYDREAEDYVDAKDSSNPSGLKLTYVAKMGTFKGSFKMYAVDAAGRLKKYTANVSGVMVGRQGYGTASVKGVGSWPVLIE